MGKVYLVGAGPGDPELLTLKAARLLERATVVLHDSLVSWEVLALIPASAEIIDVGKRAGQKLLTQDEINSLLVSYSNDHEIVIRLKVATQHYSAVRVKRSKPCAKLKSRSRLCRALPQHWVPQPRRKFR